VQFGVSTHLFHNSPLAQAHLQMVADRGFEALELFATRTHFDYHDATRVAALRDWLRQTGLTLNSVHAPITDSLVNGVWGTSYSNAATDSVRRQQAVQEARHTLRLADDVPYRYLVVHVGVPAEYASGPADNHRDAARRSVEELAEAAAQHGVQIALEVIPNDLSKPESLVRLIEDLELPQVGICMDVGHALLMGDVADAIETVAGHLVTTHLHDNDGRKDDHRVPFEGRLDWPNALMAFQKVGYDGVMLLELANSSDPQDVLARARGARTRFEEILAS